jgi:hypothetical protein
MYPVLPSAVVIDAVAAIESNASGLRYSKVGSIAPDSIDWKADPACELATMGDAAGVSAGVVQHWCSNAPEASGNCPERRPRTTSPPVGRPPSKP